MFLSIHIFTRLELTANQSLPRIGQNDVGHWLTKVNRLIASGNMECMTGAWAACYECSTRDTYLCLILQHPITKATFIVKRSVFSNIRSSVNVGVPLSGIEIVVIFS